VFPKLFQYGDFFLPTYGVLVAVAFLVGLLITTRLAKRVGMDRDRPRADGRRAAVGPEIGTD
jgi:phosphatidylglycerol:prolipoprotein diacylglycerol transferase